MVLFPSPRMIGGHVFLGSQLPYKGDAGKIFDDVLWWREILFLPYGKLNFKLTLKLAGSWDKHFLFLFLNKRVDKSMCREGLEYLLGILPSKIVCTKLLVDEWL